MLKSVDIAIVGGGLIGACLNLALAKKGISSLLIENKPLQNDKVHAFDARTLALAPASIRILTKLDVWSSLKKETTSIQAIEVSQQGNFGRVYLNKQNEAELGATVEMQTISNLVHQALLPHTLLCPAQFLDLDSKHTTLTIQQGQNTKKIKAKMIVAADGLHSTVRKISGLPLKQKKYREQALVATIGLTRSHQNKAYERFTANGSLAMLPITNNRVSLVWSLPPHEAKNLLRCEEKVFLKQLQEQFGYRLGRLIKVGGRAVYPLQQAIMPQTAAWPLVFVGNAAHTLHPVAGQGFNLGLRDVATLVDSIETMGINEAMLNFYQQQRQADQKIITTATSSLIEIFNAKMVGMNLLRSLSLLAFDNSVLAKNILTRYASGFGGTTTSFISGTTNLKAGEHAEF